MDLHLRDHDHRGHHGRHFYLLREPDHRGHHGCHFSLLRDPDHRHHHGRYVRQYQLRLRLKQQCYFLSLIHI